MFRKDTKILNKRSNGEKILFGIVLTFFILYACSLILPFFFLITNSLKDGWEYFYDTLDRQAFRMPDKLHFENYLAALLEMKTTNSRGESVFLLEMLFNSLWFSACLVLSGVIASSITAYIVAKYRFTGRRIIDGIAIFSMTIPVIGTTAAMLKLQNALQIYNSPLLPIFLGFGGFGFNFLVLRGFFCKSTLELCRISFY